MTDSDAGRATDDTPLATADIQPPGSRRDAGRRAATVALLVVVAAFAVLALRDNWVEVRASIGRLGPGDVALSTTAAVVSLLLSWRAWNRVLRALGAEPRPRASAVIYFSGQVGKYVPGSVWPMLIQAQLGASSGIGRATAVTTYGLAVLITVASAGVLGPLLLTEDVPLALTLAIAGGAVLALAIVFAIGHRRGLQRLAGWLERRLGRTLPSAHLEARELAMVVATSTLAWVGFGVHAWAIARPMGVGAGDVAPVTAAFALAFVAGLVVLPLPAGAGVREAVLVLALSPMLARPDALVVAIASRFVILLAEVGLALAAGVPGAVRAATRSRRG